jgi:outer membrane protein assembly factor BamB
VGRQEKDNSGWPSNGRAKPGWPAGAKILAAAGLILVVWLAHYFITDGRALGFGDSREWRMTDTQKGVDYSFDAGISFYSYNTRGFYCCTKDGMRYVLSNGETDWQHSFTMTNPVITARDGVVAVGENRGSHIYVYDTQGLMYDVALDTPALYFSVNESGYLAVIMAQDRGYAVSVYNRSQPVTPYFHAVIMDELRQPLAVGVSPDGKYAAISMLDTRVRMESRVLFYHMKQSDSWRTEDGMFAGEDFNGQIAYHVGFMKDNKILVVTDERMVCYQPLGEPNVLEKQWTVELHNQINQLAFYGGTRLAFVTGEAFLNDDNAAAPGTVQIYSADGAKTGEFSLGRKATFISMNRDALIVGADRAFYALDGGGNILWEHTSLQDTDGMWFLDDTNTVLLAGGTHAAVLRRERAQPADMTAESALIIGE